MTKMKKPPTDAEIQAIIAQARTRSKTPSPEASTALVAHGNQSQASQVLALIHGNNLPGFGATTEHPDDREAAEIVALSQRLGLKWAQ